MEYAFFAVLLLILASVWAAFALFFAVFQIIRDARNAVASFVLPPAEGKPSALAETCQLIGQTAGKTITASVMAQMSADQRNVNGLQKDIIMDNMEQGNPILGAMFGSLGKRTQNRLVKNPILMQALAGIISKMVGTPGGNGKEKIASSDKPRFSF